MVQSSHTKIQNLFPTAVLVAIAEKSPHPGLPVSREQRLAELVMAEICCQNAQNPRPQPKHLQ